MAIDFDDCTPINLYHSRDKRNDVCVEWDYVSAEFDAFLLLLTPFYEICDITLHPAHILASTRPDVYEAKFCEWLNDGYITHEIDDYDITEKVISGEYQWDISEDDSLIITRPDLTQLLIPATTTAP